jgi:hypothetical protein
LTSGGRHPRWLGPFSSTVAQMAEY